MTITQFLKNKSLTKTLLEVRIITAMGNVKVNNELELNIDRELKDGDIIEVGQHKFIVKEI